MEKVIESLLENGFIPDDHTAVRVERGRSVIGGRLRYKRGSIFVTVGKRTTCVYKKEGKQILWVKNFETKDATSIMRYIAEQKEGLF
ncbi:hypothetical protein EEL30_00480 (plasmid) [Brevibacillus laterosporus]|uniref:Uncharacterized protein n=1 Tax=Brevibacillus laterosporus TaxID=1465 RepID=A0A518V1X3_BRELA|nr:hypothetical protein EEL30_00480 [Brevibacillus laterosporus]